MSQPYVGEIRLVGFSFAPVGWAFCDGSLLSISQNTVLFDLIGTTYGGDGINTFALPNLSGRIPVHQGNSYVIGQMGGAESVTLTAQQIPVHTHLAVASNGPGTSDDPTNNTWAVSPGGGYSTTSGDRLNPTLRADAIGLNNGSQPHDNMPPFLAINYIISLFGVFPSQN